MLAHRLLPLLGGPARHRSSPARPCESRQDCGRCLLPLARLLRRAAGEREDD